MKFFETHFDDYLQTHATQNLHPELSPLFEQFPSKLEDLRNVLFYGPKGVGKYTQMLAAIKRYSPSELKYEKKITVNYNKATYLFKISDIHFEIDMSLLGCHAKLLWNEVFCQIIDIILAKAENTGIIVCKYFHEIHSELLESFYSYMQSAGVVNLKFILITEHLSFLPENIFNCCQVIKVVRPCKALYNACVRTKALPANISVEQITNIKLLHKPLEEDEHQTDATMLMRPHAVLCDKIIQCLRQSGPRVKLLAHRDILYDLFIYNLDVSECMWYILNKLVQERILPSANLYKVMLYTVQFFKYYNNNYRPIYHLEHYMLQLMTALQ